MECSFNVDKDITAHLWGKFIHAPDYGIYRATLDGEELAVVDLYSQKVKRQSDHWGVHKLSAGPHVLRLECTGQIRAFHRILSGAGFLRGGGARL